MHGHTVLAVAVSLAVLASSGSAAANPGGDWETKTYLRPDEVNSYVFSEVELHNSGARGAPEKCGVAYKIIWRRKSSTGLTLGTRWCFKLDMHVTGGRKIVTPTYSIAPNWTPAPFNSLWSTHNEGCWAKNPVTVESITVWHGTVRGSEPCGPLNSSARRGAKDYRRRPAGPPSPPPPPPPPPPPRKLTPQEQRQQEAERRRQEAERRKQEAERRRQEAEHRRQLAIAKQRRDVAKHKIDTARQRYEEKRRLAEVRRQERLRQLRGQPPVTPRQPRDPSAGRKTEDRKKEAEKKVAKATATRACGMVQNAWGAGPRLNYRPPRGTPPKIERRRATHRIWVGSATREAACNASATTAADGIIFNVCPKQGWKWNGEKYRLVQCTECKHKHEWGWNCTATVEVSCIVPQTNAQEIALRRQIIKQLLAHALPALNDIFDQWLQAKAELIKIVPGATSAVPGTGFLAVGTAIRNAKRIGQEVGRKVDQMTRTSNAAFVEAVDRQTADLVRAVETVTGKVAACQ